MKGSVRTRRTGRVVIRPGRGGWWQELAFAFASVHIIALPLKTDPIAAEYQGCRSGQVSE